MYVTKAELTDLFLDFKFWNVRQSK
jgi:hypothetical protein